MFWNEAQLMKQIYGVICFVLAWMHRMNIFFQFDNPSEVTTSWSILPEVSSIDELNHFRNKTNSDQTIRYRKYIVE